MARNARKRKKKVRSSSRYGSMSKYMFNNPVVRNLRRLGR